MIRIAMLIEYPVVLGFCVPMLVPFSALALAHGTAVLHKLHTTARPRAVARGETLECIHGVFVGARVCDGCVALPGLWAARKVYLVVVGMPVSACVVVWMVRKKY